MCLARSSDEPPSSEAPASRMRLMTSGDLEALTSSSLSFFTISGGVPAGAATYHHGAASKPAKPCSAMVGTSGSANQRLAELTPSALSVPDWMCGR